MLDVICIGGATRDVFFRFNNLKRKQTKDKLTDGLLEVPYGEKMVSDETFYSYGGGAINCAICFSRLGLRSASVCNLGREGTGTMVLKYLEKNKVQTKLVQRDNKNHTGLSILVIGQDGEHTGFLERGANSFLKIPQITPFSRSRWFYISSLTGESSDILPHLFDFARRHQIKIAFNPGSSQLSSGYKGLKNFLAQTEVLILNSEEAEDLVVSKTGKKPRTSEELMNQIAKMGASINVVTEGKKGSFAFCDGKHYHAKAYSEEVVDTTGAGDAFGATFVFGVIKGFDLSYSLKIAAINSASVVGKMGAGEGLLTYNKIRSSKWL